MMGFPDALLMVSLVLPFGLADKKGQYILTKLANQVKSKRSFV